MSDAPPAALHQAELSFFGAVTASLSHQINNVLTIISELNGLSEDLLTVAQAGGGSVDRLQATTARIGGNLDRCVEYLRVLNRFAHSADHDSAHCRLGDLVLLLQAITRRFFELRKAALEVVLPEREVVVVTRPFALLHLLFRALRSALSAAGEGGGVQLTLEDLEERVEVRLSTARASGRGTQEDHDLPILVDLCREMSVTLVLGDEPSAFPLRIVIPRGDSHPIELETR